MSFNKSFVLSLVLLSALIAMAVPALAQTPAGTQIRNRSSATYEDLSGNTFSTTSNEVITIVLPVYGVSVLPDDSGENPPLTPSIVQNAIPGLTVYYRYDLTNVGNDLDSYSLVPLVDGANTTFPLVASDVIIYHDLNGDGVVNVGEPVISVGGVPGIIGPMIGTASLIVAYTVPAGAVAGDVAYVGLTATSIGDPLQFDTRNYHRTDVVNDAVMTANLTGAPPIVFEGNPITYSFSGTNTGNNTANGVTVGSVALTGVLIYDIIPIDPSTGNPLLVLGAPTGSPAGGTVVYLPNGSSTAGSPETWAWSTTAAASDIAVGFITSTGIIAGQSYTFDYQVTVPFGHPAGVVNNDVTLAYVDNDVASPDPTLVISNNAPVTVGTLGDVLIGPVGFPGAGSPPNFDDDVQVAPIAYAGSSIDFVNTIQNNGNATDIVNVILDGASTIPGTWSVQFFQADGVTPLVDNGVDGLVDVGPLAAGASRDIVVRILIPGTQGAGGPFDTVVRAQSTNDPAEANLTTDQITTVISAGVDIGNNDGVSGTTNNATVNLLANPATFVDFGLDVINTSAGTADTYTLSSSIPAGWTVTYFDDANGNGVLDAGEIVPIFAIAAAAGAEVNVIARVDIPAGTIAAVYPTDFTATSANNPAQSDTINNTVTVNTFDAVIFDPDAAGSTTPGGTIAYAHTVSNTGNQADVFDLTYASTQGWTYVFYDVLNNPITSIAVAPGVTANITVRLNVPAGALIGTVETGTLTATGQAFGATDFVTDVTVVVAGNFQLTKSVNPLGDQLPGTNLTYTVDYQNIGTATITNVVVFDAMPAFTDYQVGSETAGTAPATVTAIATQFSNDGGATWIYVPVSGGGGALAGYDRIVTNIRWVFTGDILAGASSSAGLGFTVSIQ